MSLLDLAGKLAQLVFQLAEAHLLARHSLSITFAGAMGALGHARIGKLACDQAEATLEPLQAIDQSGKAEILGEGGRCAKKHDGGTQGRQVDSQSFHIVSLGRSVMWPIVPADRGQTKAQRRAPDKAPAKIRQLS